jgi:hypothetical protein
MQSSSPKLPLALATGIAGEAAGSVCVAVTRAAFFASSSVLDPSVPPEPASPQRAGPAPGGKRGKGITSFWRGTLVSTVTAAVFALLFGVAVFFVFRAEANAPPPSGDFDTDLSGLDTAIHLLLSLAGAGTGTILTSLVLMWFIVVPVVPTKAGRIIYPILFTLLSAILNLLLDLVIYTVVYPYPHPIR